MPTTANIEITPNALRCLEAGGGGGDGEGDGEGGG
eukprot:CAMPEP_0184656748 /NCGR_PEP_ID=MMETSP0308-20130426/16727_1 /TAXON_ID=38269 /ORGANISM="Gloeochaete witrockiana, Strain SAG 46.84" /LENGTH=34 /DNA_ID= /DNA_START= /DNA_END= /DNA_ORIENTATION=